MATTTWFTRAARLLAVLLVGVLAAACANNENQPSSQLTGRDGSVTPGSHRDFSVNVGDIVYFTTDSTDLTPEATAILQKQSQWLQQYPQYTITIEGHADERGTREYNIALGARRATTVRNFLAQNGINGSRIRTISYGKERPVAVCNEIPGRAPGFLFVRALQNQPLQRSLWRSSRTSTPAIAIAQHGKDSPQILSNDR
jgi:peptidoglycan-associated lipoprotein